MNGVDKQLEELYKFVEQCKSKHPEGSSLRFDFHAILCRLNSIGDELEAHHIIEKCRCCCADG